MDVLGKIKSLVKLNHLFLLAFLVRLPDNLKSLIWLTSYFFLSSVELEGKEARHRHALLTLATRWQPYPGTEVSSIVLPSRGKH